MQVTPLEQIHIYAEIYEEEFEKVNITFCCKFDEFSP